ncbi:PPE domain-containing protein [Nocardia sp. NPDC051756]|uniref:PPE domain-containing protein n=1 Tax=Nocardia sp. NPDC051756 TaxID=3154751 RepID=UPI003413B6FC
MVEAPQAGFTGTIWDAVPAEQLAHELTTGPGTTPMADVGLAYAELAVGLGAAGTEFRAILAVVGDVWGSTSNEDGLAQLAQLADWFDEVTAAAKENAATAAQQAVSYEVAQLTMPHVGEVAAAVRTAADLLSGSLLGAPLAGLLDTADHQVEALHAQAAQVMRTYEAASEKLAVPWEQDAAPAVSAGAALAAEQAPARPEAGQPGPPANAPVVAEPTLAAPTVDLSALHVAPPPTVPVGSESLVLTPTLPPSPTIAPGPAAPLPVSAAQPAPPPIVAPPASTTTPAPPQPAARAEAAEVGDIGDRFVVDAGFATAPPVLGGAAVHAGQEGR